jgi:hypothetical protein
MPDVWLGVAGEVTREAWELSHLGCGLVLRLPILPYATRETASNYVPAND